MPGPPTAQVLALISLTERGPGRLLGEPCDAQAEVRRRWSRGEKAEAGSQWPAQGLTAGLAELRVPAAHSPRVANPHCLLDPQIVSLGGDAYINIVC